MARVTDVAPKNDVYVGMLLLAVLAMTFGILLLALEANEYGWESEPPKSGPSISLPAIKAAPRPATTGATTALPAEETPAEPVAKPSPVKVDEQTPAIVTPTPAATPQPGFVPTIPQVPAIGDPTLPPVKR